MDEELWILMCADGALIDNELENLVYLQKLEAAAFRVTRVFDLSDLEMTEKECRKNFGFLCRDLYVLQEARKLPRKGFALKIAVRPHESTECDCCFAVLPILWGSMIGSTCLGRTLLFFRDCSAWFWTMFSKFLTMTSAKLILTGYRTIFCENERKLWWRKDPLWFLRRPYRHHQYGNL